MMMMMMMKTDSLNYHLLRYSLMLIFLVLGHGVELYSVRILYHVEIQYKLGFGF